MEEQSVGWFAAIIIGGLAGWLAEKFMKSDMGIFMNILLGIVGAIVAKFFADWLFKELGFKLSLAISTAVSALGILAMGLYTPETPVPLIISILVFTGF